MAKSDSPEIPVRLVIGDFLDEEIGTVTLDAGDTPEKVVAEFLVQVAEEIMAQTANAKQMIAAGFGKVVMVPAGETPGGEWVRGAPGEGVIDLAQPSYPGLPAELLQLVASNAQDVQDGGCKPCKPVPYQEGDAPAACEDVCHPSHGACCGGTAA